MNFNKDMLLLYAVTDRSNICNLTLYEHIEKALQGGVTCLQLREKNLSEGEFISEAVKVKELCLRYNVPLIINDNADVAIKSGADGVHVGIEDAPVDELRKKLPKGFIIGATAKTIEQAKAAEKAGADYIGVGAVFPSPTKANAIRITHKELHEICSAVSIPSVAIGGISYDNMDELKGGGMDGVALVSAIFCADDIYTATMQLKEKAKAVTNK